MNKLKCKTKKVDCTVGPICVGKSAYLVNKENDYDYKISSDDIVEQICTKYNISYKQFHKLKIKDPIRVEQRNRFDQAVEESKQHESVVWDLTNLTRNDRARIMRHYPNAEFHAIVFTFKGWEEDILKLSHERFQLTGKFIPPKVFASMCERYEPVSMSEGFSEIKSINMISLILKAKIKHEVVLCL